LQNMMDSFTGNAFTIPDDAVHVDQEPDPMGLSMDEADTIEDELPTNMEFVGSMYNSESLPSPEETADSMLEGDLSGLASPPVTRAMGKRRVLESFQEQYEVSEDPEPLDFGEDYFGTESQVKEKPAKWNSAKNEYDMVVEFPTHQCPFKLRVRDVHFIFNMFDGYDWAKTRDEVTNAVDRLEKQAEERRMKNRAAEEPDDTVIGDHLFNSIWIEVRPDAQPHELRRQVKMDLDDLISESESYATTTVSRTPTASTAKPRRSRLRFGRSKHQKMTIELTGVSADVFVFPPNSGETQSSVDVRVKDLEIFDHVPSSTWKKFATYMHDAGEREMGKPMVRLELLTVKPVQDLMASELVIKVRSHYAARESG
jgi:autophagy-related protein 2